MDVVPRERRASLRQMVGPLTYVTLDGANGGILVDLCDRGLRVHSVAPLRTGAQVEVEFTLPGTSSPLSASGMVAWADGSGQSGLRFLAPEAVHSDINQWIFSSFLAPHENLPSDSPVMAQPSAQKQLAAMAAAEPAAAPPLAPKSAVTPTPRLHLPVQLSPESAFSRADVLLLFIALGLFAWLALWRSGVPAALGWAFAIGMAAASLIWLGYLWTFGKNMPGRELEALGRDFFRRLTRR